MEHSGTYFTLKRAARVLGVREQTLKTWERRGVIRLVHLPGSRYRQVAEEEVGRLQDQMSARTPTADAALMPPHTDEQSLVLAEELVQLVLEDLQSAEAEGSLDEAMAERRGRAWLG